MLFLHGIQGNFRNATSVTACPRQAVGWDVSPPLLENWLPTPARSGSHCRGKWRQAASVSENLASLYKVQIPFQSVNSSKLIQPAQERNRIGLVCCAPHMCGRGSSWQALGATSVGEPVTQEGSLTLLSVRGEQIM